MSDKNARQIGYYVEIKRGSWVKYGDEPTERFPAGGLSYSGSITKEQMEGIDGLIRNYLEGAPSPELEKRCQERRGSSWQCLLEQGHVSGHRFERVTTTSTIDPLDSELADIIQRCQRLSGKDDGRPYGVELFDNQWAAIVAALRRAAPSTTALEAEVARLEALVYVPGVWACAKCKLSLISTTLSAASGKVKANTEPQKCPNGCGPLWRKTERAAGNELIDRMDQTWNTAVERAAKECERQIDDDEARGRLQARSVLTRCAAAIRALTAPCALPSDQTDGNSKA